MNTCSRCKETKESAQFHKDPRKSNGVSSWCKPCVSFSSRRWYLKNFDRCKKNSEIYYKNNREKCVENQRRYTSRNKELALGRNLVRYWPDCSPMEAYKKYADLEVKQNKLCAICKKPETCIDYRTKKTKRLSVDHCHSTGTVRGLLCAKHNKAIGLLGESVDILHSAIEYIERNKNVKV